MRSFISTKDEQLSLGVSKPTQCFDQVVIDQIISTLALSDEFF